MDELIANYPAIIELMESRFDSHTFILELAHAQQAAYVAALNNYAAGGTPFQTLHAQLSKALHGFPNLVQYVDEVRSPNIFGRVTPCAQWRKL